jgi:hypothetical protein
MRVSSGDGYCLRSLSFGQVRASSTCTCTEPLTSQPLSDEEASHVVDNVALRTAIKDFFKLAAAGLKVGGDPMQVACTGSNAGAPGGGDRRERGGDLKRADLLLLDWIQETGVVTVEMSFWDRTEHVPITVTWEDYLHKRGLGSISHLTFFELATWRDLTRGATLEEMGYRGGKLAVGFR